MNGMGKQLKEALTYLVYLGEGVGDGAFVAPEAFRGRPTATNRNRFSSAVVVIPQRKTLLLLFPVLQSRRTWITNLL